MKPRLSRARSLVFLALVAVAVPTAGSAGPSAPSMAQDRSVDPVVLKGSQFPQWSAGPDPTFRAPQVANDATGRQSQCRGQKQNQWSSGDHNCYQDSQIPRNPVEGAAVDRLLGFRWNGTAWEEIPFQVDERFTRYLTNNASDFAVYSGADRHNTYAFDREGFRFTDNDPGNVCKPIPREDPAGSGSRPSTMQDPVKGLDDDDELVFMHRDTGAQAPPATALPPGIETAAEVAVSDPSRQTEATKFAYVMLAREDGPRASFTADDSPYVRYQRDTGPTALGADLFVYSQSSYGGYGKAPAGAYCDPATGLPVKKADGTYDIKQRRPLDTAWVHTPRYKFRYEGRWLMTALHVAAGKEGNTDPDPAKWTYGPDIIDRWKARAFQQDPSSETPCCGYEEEDTNWGGSSILMGERRGPVRVIRETWGADSSTNNVRRETFYRDMFVWGDALRVHPIPPLDGIYSQWDYNAGIVTRYYNPTASAIVDGQNDEVFGNLDDPCNSQYDGRNSQIDETYRQTYKQAQGCSLPYHQSVDVTDPTMGSVEALMWEQSSGPFGGMVTRTVIRDHNPGGDAQALLAVPYYRDDSCFDDGTGTDPGPRRYERSETEAKTYTVPGDPTPLPRSCWKPGDEIDTGFVAGPDPVRPSLGDEFGDERYYQGDIGAHGVHLLFVAESDNGYATVPVTEIDTEQRVVVIPGTLDNVGERYGRFVEFPLTSIARPYP